MTSSTDSPASACSFFLPSRLSQVSAEMAIKEMDSFSVVPHPMVPYFLLFDLLMSPYDSILFLSPFCSKLSYMTSFSVFISSLWLLLFHRLSWLLLFHLLNFFSLSTLYLDAFIHFHGLKYHLCADNSKTYICSIACSSKLRSYPIAYFTSPFRCLAGI